MNSFKKNIYRTVVEDICPTCADGVVTIGTQIWTTCNSSVIEYTDTTPIPEVTDPTAWAALTTGAWCHVNNNPANDAIYGKLYNWYAVAGIYDAASLANPALRKQFAPAGYHVPTNLEMTTLVTYLGGNTVAGGKMKEVGTTHWNSPNTGATNTSCFTALGSGYRFYVTGAYVLFNQYAYWWSATDITTDGASTFYVRHDVPNCEVSGAVDKNYGFSVRLIQD
jgi:uncharacterized protein (TIGR02145 family)